jgi:hypothetical protein
MTEPHLARPPDETLVSGELRLISMRVVSWVLAFARMTLAELRRR